MITPLVIAARVFLAGAFAVAGATKLADRPGTREAMDGFGVPSRLVRPLALLLPVVELTVAVLLLPAATAVVGAAAALFVLALFSVAIAVNLARGRTPECHCFGQLHSAPVGWRTLGRNAVLAGVALFALGATLAEPQTSATAWLGDLEAAELLALVVVVTSLALLGVGTTAFMTLMRSYGKVLVRLDRVEAMLAEAGIHIGPTEPMPELGHAPGTPAPAFTAMSVAGDMITLESLTASGLPTLLVFTSPSCGPCKTLLPTAAEWQRDHASALQIVFVTDGAPDEIRLEAEEFELENVLLDGDHELYDRFEANGTPSAVLITTDGTIGSWVAPDSEWIEQLVAHFTAEASEPEGLPVGTEAPAVELPALDGKPVSLADLRGHDTLLLFWNPDCGFCRSMHEDLVEWEKSANGEGPQLVVVSSGEEESTRAESFGSLVLLDETWQTASALGAGGTPMAVLIDAEGRIASGVVAGADAVLDLAAGHKTERV